ncbi:Acyl-CoA desaturase [Rhizoctonia solani]|uniref:Acyl-CoA desaturase n=1 Tax=Rhizoctonia solani TaxID=456999 RepID=A0A8H7M4V0_9AGAM|nr:Acyl-CoA desaturase [Rhizoctonia solani]
MPATAGAYRRSAPFSKDETVPSDMNIPDNYVQHTLLTTKSLPPVTIHNWWKELNYISCFFIFVTPLVAVYGAVTTSLQSKTAWFALFWYFVTGLGITAGYHRYGPTEHTTPQNLSSISWPLLVPALYKARSSGGLVGIVRTIATLTPSLIHTMLIWDSSGLISVTKLFSPSVHLLILFNKVAQWQHRWYLWLILTMSFGIPTAVPGLLWGDWRGGFFYAGVARLCFVHHSTWCVNSLAHWLGERSFDDKHTPRDHLITALVTIGEGYHNFHHQFPMDYRNAIKWYQYDPTKWFIAAMSWLGLASQLKVFPDNEVKKGQMTMELKKLKERADKIEWPKTSNDLPVIGWDEFQAHAKKRNLVLVSGFIHDITSFMDEHPGGRHLLSKNIGKDATAAFWGGVYEHSNAAHNLLAMMRVGVLRGGLEIESERAIPPSQKLRVVSHSELVALVSPSGTSSDIRATQDHSPPIYFDSENGLVFGASSASEDESPKTPALEETKFEFPSK